MSGVVDFDFAIRSASRVIAFGLATLKLSVATSGSPNKLTPAPSLVRANINSPAAGVSS